MWDSEAMDMLTSTVDGIKSDRLGYVKGYLVRFGDTKTADLEGDYFTASTDYGFPVGTANTGIVGVFVGCSYINAQGQVIYAQYYPTGTTGVINAYVVDDPGVVFQVQSAGSVTQAAVGANVFFSTGAVATGSTSTGNSTASVVAGSSAVTTTAAFRVVGFVNMQGFSVVGDAYTDILVKINPGYHTFTNAVGL